MPNSQFISEICPTHIFHTCAFIITIIIHTLRVKYAILTAKWHSMQILKCSDSERIYIATDSTMNPAQRNDAVS